MNKEIEQQIHEFAEKMYQTGYADGNNTKEAYQEGLNDAWECAKKLTLLSSDGGFNNKIVKEIFGTASYYSIINNMSISTVVTKIKDYEEKQKQKDDEIHIGDEVILKRENTKAVVCDVSKYTDKQPYSILMGDDGMPVYVNKNDITKTGKHYSQIEEVLKKLRGDEE